MSRITKNIKVPWANDVCGGGPFEYKARIESLSNLPPADPEEGKLVWLKKFSSSSLRLVDETTGEERAETVAEVVAEFWIPLVLLVSSADKNEVNRSSPVAASSLVGVSIKNYKNLWMYINI